MKQQQYKYISVLTIAGSDSGGGAGIQADLKTFAALGCFGTSAITAITVQNTTGVTDIHPIPPHIVTGQIKAVMDDIKPAAVKIGMIHSADIASAIVDVLKAYKGVPIILDPVMISSSGRQLIENETITVLQQQLFPLVTLITPNLDEAAVLSGMPVRHLDDMKAAAVKILETGCNAVLIKGGHLAGTKLYNLYLDKSGKEHIITSDSISTHNTHGTGCTLSSAIAAFLARGFDIIAAIEQAGIYMHTAIEEGRDVKTGEGHGPVNHFFDPVKQILIQ
ncbi:hydroxymethylpyrimidine/phosphomethylpyrimidine kinase [Chitinophaga sp. CF118]|uniref:bifunctional hydroxymethylpyrimidine kinase/phosphomethylpyrimidine kinase n=1 Tax=Chitinophaga sp. CF118 TaxID=1884367 RepID=UPI0008ECBBE9|nr:bifunctional hydroxymethylpyrimidine kinase/phosphomethylpyrimidine kinase [Chitinophaga sp. CF118]SFF01732.1 hydroxymethylpyrimidine/phosphomethylpyrimidine kinase [Chitinophaga sp. CF118]